ncbi:TPA: hypothetical protein QDB04_002283 [Burkholderia vietnamiensis]|nr:hypothetical protein [Burkholderia vietnamiensis]
MDAARHTNPPAVTGPFAADSLQLLHIALQWWQAYGFAYTDLPWMVPKQYTDAFRPSHCRDVPTLHGNFVGSGEQSFLMLRDENRLPGPAPGYIGWTPCLRDERLDHTHQHGFMKAEWFVPLDDDTDWHAKLLGLLSRQSGLFYALATQVLGEPLFAVTHEQVTPEQIDLVINGMEVGSYGLRIFHEKPYLFGTGLALPRFHKALGNPQS